MKNLKLELTSCSAKRMLVVSHTSINSRGQTTSDAAYAGCALVWNGPINATLPITTLAKESNIRPPSYLSRSQNSIHFPHFIMASHKELAQRLLHLARFKLDKETSAGEPRLFRVLVCANMADNACRSAREGETRQRASERECRRRRHSMSPGNRRTARASSPAAFMNLGDKCIRGTQPEQAKTMQTLSRPQASLCDRTAFRRSIVRSDERLDDNSVGSDSDPHESDPMFSDDDDGDDYDNDDDYSEDDGSDYSSGDEDDFDLRPRQDHNAPAQRLSSTELSSRTEEKSRPSPR